MQPTQGRGKNYRADLQEFAEHCMPKIGLVKEFKKEWMFWKIPHRLKAIVDFNSGQFTEFVINHQDVQKKSLLEDVDLTPCWCAKLKLLCRHFKL